MATDPRGQLPDWTLTGIQRSDLDLLVTGGFAPLVGFHTRAEAQAVADAGELPDGTPWPAPVTLAVDVQTADRAADAGRLALRDEEGTLLAVLTVTDRWDGPAGAGLGGPVEGIRASARWDFAELRRPVSAVRDEVAASGRPAVLAAQPPGPVNAQTAARWGRAAAALDATLLVLAPVGADADHVHVPRVRAYRRLVGHLPADARLRLLASARDPYDPEAAALHAVVARNAGATHLVVHSPIDAAAVERMGLVPVDPETFAADDDPPPDQFHDDVAAELAAGDPPPRRRGLVLLLTGLSGSGKSTVAKVVAARVMEAGDRRVTLLDGDLVRRHLSSELGFSRDHRDLNVRRIGYVASEIAKHGGVAICAPIAPYDATRRDVRRMIEDVGGRFVLVHVATPLAVCEARDAKGLYARARAGELTGFTGVDDPYEDPTDAEVVVDTSELAPTEAAALIVAHLAAQGLHDPAA